MPGLALVFWAVAALLFAAVSEAPSWQTATTVVAYWLVATFSAGSLAWAARRASGREHLFWSLLCGGLLLRLAGYLLWLGSRGAPASGRFVPEPEHAAYVLSYLLLFGAMLVLVADAVRGITFVAALDAAAILLTSGMLVWRFVLGPTVGPEAGGVLGALALLFRPMVDAGLLFLALVALSTARKPPSAPLLAAAFVAFLLADASYLGVKSAGGVYELGSWAELLWALGILLLGLAAGRPGFAPEGSAAPLGIGAVRQAAFWAGPLSPLVHYGALLASGVVAPPLPGYVAAGGVLLMLYAILRTSLAAGIGERFRSEHEAAARRAEQGRISEALHSTLKQSIYRVALLLDAYRRLRGKDPAAAERILSQAAQASQEARYQVGRPIGELSALHGGIPGLDPVTLLRQLLAEAERHFGIEAHEDLRVPLEKLGAERLAAAYRVASEAIWNAAKHSGAENVWLESREEGTAFVIEVRDDGCGFPRGARPATGFGLPLMRARAEGAGGNLEVASKLRAGTTVRLVFAGMRIGKA